MTKEILQKALKLMAIKMAEMDCVGCPIPAIECRSASGQSFKHCADDITNYYIMLAMAKEGGKK